VNSSHNLRILAVCVLLAGCAHKPEPVVVTRDVVLPVRHGCTTTVDPVELETPASDDVFDLAKAAAIRIRQLAKENRSLRAALDGCR
jgi:hypothetical protein